MEVIPIKPEQDYRRTLKEIESLMTARPDTPEGSRLDVPVTPVEARGAQNNPLDPPDPIDSIRSRLDQKWLAGKDFVSHIGGRKRLYEVPQHSPSGATSAETTARRVERRRIHRPPQKWYMY